VLEDSVFKKTSARAIARSLKRSAEQSTQRKSSSYRSAMSMITFYVNRAGKNLARRGNGKAASARLVVCAVQPSSMGDWRAELIPMQLNVEGSDKNGAPKARFRLMK
jgi:hypothetical protein